MDDRQAPAVSPPLEYRCPGETHPIDRAVHWTRLATFFPACLECSHRNDSGGLSTLQLRQRREVEQRAAHSARWDDEGCEGTAAGEIDADVVGRVAGALAASLWSAEPAPGDPPSVLVGTDGNWTTADFLPVACHTLQRAGCCAVECGAVTSAALAVAARLRGAHAALWIGNATGAPHATSIRLWHAGGCPSSSPGRLDAVREGFSARPARPKRGGGRLERCAADELYLRMLAGMFHGLRPLFFVLDTSCGPLVRYWRRLSAPSACRMISPSRVHAETASGAGALASVPSHDTLARWVLTEGAHFGVWIDGAGERLRLVDERGVAVDAERLLLLLAVRLCQQKRGAAIVLEPQSSGSLQRGLERIDARGIGAHGTRQAVCERMEATGAPLGGGASGRYWFAGPPPVADALLCLSLLVAIMSESDRPLSAVLDAAAPTG